MAKPEEVEQYNKAAWEKFGRVTAALSAEHIAICEAIESTIQGQLDEEHQRYDALLNEAHRVLTEETDAWFAVRRRVNDGAA